MLRAGGTGCAACRRRADARKRWPTSVISGLADERFLILPHPQVAEYVRRKGSDYDRWIAGMIRFRRRLLEGETAADARDKSRMRRRHSLRGLKSDS